jgi:uncharacterized protein YgiM (DUF1202 family)
MTTQKSSVFVLLLGALFLGACAASPTATPTPAPTLAPTRTPVPTSTPLPPTPTPESPTATPAPPTATQIPPVATAKIIINVRAGPSAGYPLLGKLKKGEKKPIIGKSEDSMWWQIQFDGKAGWIPRDYTDVQGGTNLVAIVSIAPLPTPTQVPTQVALLRVSTPTATPTVLVPPPNGRVYFTSVRNGSYYAAQLKLANKELSPAVELGTSIGDLALSTNASPLDWSEAVGKLAYVFNNGAQDKLQILDANSNLSTLASHGAILSPRWFSDGQQIAFVGYDNGFLNQKIYIVNAADGKETQVCPARAGEQLRGLAVNARTGEIAFVSNYSGTFEIWRMDRSCSSPSRLTNDNADDSAPAFSPDGTKIAYVSNKTAPTDHLIYVMSANGGNAAAIGPSESFAPAFSPDGQWLTFAHNLEVYIMDLEGGNIQPLAPGDRPTWAP